MTEPLHPNLRGRVAIVTGASRGVGKALALRLAREGADVVIAAKSEESTERLPGSALSSLVEKTITEFGRIDIVVNNAGAIWMQPILQTPGQTVRLADERQRACRLHPVVLCAAAYAEAALGAHSEYVSRAEYATIGIRTASRRTLRIIP